MHGVDLWIEYIVIKKEFRRRGLALALMQKLIEYADSSDVDRIYTFINPDNTPSLRLHSKARFDVEDWKIAIFQMKAAQKSH